MSELHSSIVSLVSLAAGIASNHPDMGQCQLERLRKLGVSEEHIAAVIEVARHIRDEAAQKLDEAFNAASYPAVAEVQSMVENPGDGCCSVNASGQSCC
jgi:hypothetical protein